MSYVKLLLIFIIGTTTVVRGESSIKRILNREATCTENGWICDGCKTGIFCFQPPVGEIIQNPQACASDETCIEGIGCTTDLNPDCEISIAPTCVQPGFIPNLFDCNSYHLCVANEDGSLDIINFKCNNGFGYDTLTALCRKPLDTCNRVSCTVTGQLVGDSNSPNLYYRCLPNPENALIPWPFYCDPDQEFINGGCRDPTPAEMSLDGDGKCSKTDNYPHADCKKYNKCVVGVEPEIVNCEAGKKFDYWAQACVPFKCTF